MPAGITGKESKGGGHAPGRTIYKDEAVSRRGLSSTDACASASLVLIRRIQDPDPMPTAAYRRAAVINCSHRSRLAIVDDGLSSADAGGFCLRGTVTSVIIVPDNEVMPTKRTILKRPSQKSGALFWFSYHAPLWETKAPSQFRDPDYSRSIHQVRDAAAFCELQPILLERYKWGSLLLNLPSKAFPRGTSPEAGPEISAEDLLVCVTRPPISDSAADLVPRIDRSETDLERAVLSAIHSNFLEICSRTEVKLVPALADACENAGAANRAHAKFRPKRSACYDRTWAKENLGKGGDARTAGYVLYMPRISSQPNSPRLLVAFGQSGVETLIVTTVLTRRFENTLRKIIESQGMHFVLLEWPKPYLPVRPVSLAPLINVAATVEVLAHLVAPPGTTAWKLDKNRP